MELNTNPGAGVRHVYHGGRSVLGRNAAFTRSPRHNWAEDNAGCWFFLFDGRPESRSRQVNAY